MSMVGFVFLLIQTKYVVGVVLDLCGNESLCSIKTQLVAYTTELLSVFQQVLCALVLVVQSFPSLTTDLF